MLWRACVVLRSAQACKLRARTATPPKAQQQFLLLSLLVTLTISSDALAGIGHISSPGAQEVARMRGRALLEEGSWMPTCELDLGWQVLQLEPGSFSSVLSIRNNREVRHTAATTGMAVSGAASGGELHVVHPLNCAHFLP